MSDRFIGLDVGGTKIASATLCDGSLPAAMVELRFGTLTVLLDEAAASQL